tara:strand:- start:410 stop:724 length:315 start_codon:yes stop_codon:yes gene_type:complete
MKLKDEEVKHIAELARLELSAKEVKLYAKQLTEILDYVDKINELKLPIEAPQMAHATGGINVLREDVVQGCDAQTRKKLIEAFPHREGDLLESAAVFSDRNEDL